MQTSRNIIRGYMHDSIIFMQYEKKRLFLRNQVSKGIPFITFRNEPYIIQFKLDDKPPGDHSRNKKNYWTLKNDILHAYYCIACNKKHSKISLKPSGVGKIYGQMDREYHKRQRVHASHDTHHEALDSRGCLMTSTCFRYQTSAKGDTHPPLWWRSIGR